MITRRSNRNISRKIDISYESENEYKKDTPQQPATPFPSTPGEPSSAIKPNASKPTKKTSPQKSSPKHLLPSNPPKNWLQTYNKIKEYRLLNKAPVDTLGCTKLFKSSNPKIKRFQIFISLLLSSQTKDAVTAVAMSNLHSLCDKIECEIIDGKKDLDLDSNTCVARTNTRDGLTIEKILKAPFEEINTCINKVAFHQKKTTYIQQISSILQQDFNSDIPSTIPDLLNLPGIGPKMAFLCMSEAWNECVGIGVDTHVLRISERLGWAINSKNGKDAEYCRKVLESWLPVEYWQEINLLFVGFGQTVCFAVKPNCEECPVKDTCPSVNKNSKK